MQEADSPPIGGVQQLLDGSINVEDVVLECADALTSPYWDHDVREGHLEMIDRCLLADGISDELSNTLLHAANIFSELSRLNEMELVVRDTQQEEVGLISRLLSYVPRTRQFLYHGTIAGNLTSIATVGFGPNKHAVWNGYVASDALKEGTYFDCSWRGALDWAAVAHANAKGLKNSNKRRLAVIRLRVAQHKTEPDKQAVKPGCTFVRNCIPVTGAEFFVGDQKGLPNWLPIDDARSV